MSNRRELEKFLEQKKKDIELFKNDKTHLTNLIIRNTKEGARYL